MASGARSRRGAPDGAEASARPLRVGSRVEVIAKGPRGTRWSQPFCYWQVGRCDPGWSKRQEWRNRPRQEVLHLQWRTWHLCTSPRYRYLKMEHILHQRHLILLPQRSSEGRELTQIQDQQTAHPPSQHWGGRGRGSPGPSGSVSAGELSSSEPSTPADSAGGAHRPHAGPHLSWSSTPTSLPL